MKLTRLHEEFIDIARRPMTFGALPVMPKGADVPLMPVNKWQKSKDYLKKSYAFREVGQRNTFVNQILKYEVEVGHNANIIITEEAVELTLKTHDVGVTELDKEYAKHADELFRDVVYSSEND